MKYSCDVYNNFIWFWYDLHNELNIKNNDNAVRVMTRGGKMTQEPLYPKGHPKRARQDSQRTNTDA